MTPSRPISRLVSPRRPRRLMHRAIAPRNVRVGRRPRHDVSEYAPFRRRRARLRRTKFMGQASLLSRSPSPFSGYSSRKSLAISTRSEAASRVPPGTINVPASCSPDRAGGWSLDLRLEHIIMHLLIGTPIFDDSGESSRPGRLSETGVHSARIAAGAAIRRNDQWRSCGCSCGGSAWVPTRRHTVFAGRLGRFGRVSRERR